MVENKGNALIRKQIVHILLYWRQNPHDYFFHLVEETLREQKTVSDIVIFLATNSFPVLN